MMKRATTVTIQIQKPVKPEWWEEVAKKIGTKIDETTNHFITKASGKLNNMIAWIEDGIIKADGSGWGWKHIWKKHVTGEAGNGTRFSKITDDLSEANIKNIIKNTIENPKLVKESSTKYCSISSVIKDGYYVVTIIAKKSHPLGKPGTVITSYPTNELNFICGD